MSQMWKTTTPESAGAAVRFLVRDMVGDVNRKVASKGTRAVNILRNAELQVLKGQRSGKVYRKPHSKASYTASAPGEAPARRTGNLRLHWNGEATGQNNVSGGVTVTASLESQEEYAALLEHGTKHGTHYTAPRPFVNRIIEKAAPEIEKLFKDL